MSSYSHFQFKIYLRRSLTLSLWCLMLTGFKPHPLHPLTPAPAPPLREPVIQARGPLLQTAGPCLPTCLPAGQPPNPSDTPSQARFLTPSSLFRPGEKLPAPLGPQVSGSWNLQTLLLGAGGPNHQPLHAKQVWGRGGSLPCREAQNLHCWFHIYIIFS